jgi:hypothetical protein
VLQALEVVGGEAEGGPHSIIGSRIKENVRAALERRRG